MAAEQRRKHVADEIEVSAGSAGLRMGCRRCGEIEIVLLEESVFDRHVRTFMKVHPTTCSC